ncbi:DUF2726 domain-containing protein [Burkholderia territorii]|uniref:DUF2726 domain-containing protein n=1 Tax=Burkholderia territorii TaxID=1503055 RepID=UPI0018C63FC9|nr:DUF2726 domain-containing protein [Burkholderia territorii]
MTSLIGAIVVVILVDQGLLYQKCNSPVNGGWISHNFQAPPTKNICCEKRQFMNSRQLKFLNLMNSTLPGATIYYQVAMAAVVDIKIGPRWLRKFSRLNSLEFVVCLPNGEALYAIELDCGNQDRRHAERCAQVKRNITAAAGIPLIIYRDACIRSEILQADFEEIILHRNI